MKVDKSNQCFFITPLLDTLSMKTFHQITGTAIALVILSARFIELGKVDLVYPFFVSSVRSSYSHPDLLLITTHPTFSDHTGPR